MRRATRIGLNLFLPPLVAAVTLVVLSFGLSQGNLRTRGSGALSILPGVLVGSYVVALIPSVLFAIYMEGVYARVDEPSSNRALLQSTLGGAGAGLLIASFFFLLNRHGPPATLAFLIPPALGAWTGAMVGLVLFLVDRRAIARRERTNKP